MTLKIFKVDGIILLESPSDKSGEPIGIEKDKE
jgi:hypothetical protein